MSDRTPEEDRLETQRIQAEENARKEHREAEKWKAKLDQKDRASKRQFWSTVIVALLTLTGTAIGVFFGVGKKADPSITNFWGTVYQGAVSTYKTVDSHYTVADAFPKAVPTPSTIQVPPVVQPSPASTPSVPAPAPAQPVAPITDDTCSGLNEQNWAIIPSPVTTFTEANGFNGYSVRLNLKNLAQTSVTIQHATGELSDDQGHSLGLMGSSINSYREQPTIVDPGVALPTTFQFHGHGNNGKTVSFTVNVLTSNDGGKTVASNVIGCTTLPVHQVVKE